MVSSFDTSSHSNQPVSAVSNLYCILSAFFFGACAYAQLNDPDPFLWVLSYTGLGVFPNLLVTTCPPKSIPIGTLRMILLGLAALLTCTILYKIISVIPKLELEASKGLGWHFLEHEEGRDSCGLLLLVLHTLYLCTAFLQDPQLRRLQPLQQRSSQNNNRFVSSISAVASSPVVQAVGLLSVLVGAVYLWLVHHPDMVAKYKVPHCQGGMFGREGVGGEL
ncbi:transmembrane family 220 helix protein [Nitzschia inconspicua]|uniref:Transmembrane family 220 helix protein n=1 Tax=Nitzschia inconspicua TaxID=303405 RepID=A0A9K3KYM1_9STRA|nr:transmembrane family 220 helix protein [Nitzschia inconspicua]